MKLVAAKLYLFRTAATKHQSQDYGKKPKVGVEVAVIAVLKIEKHFKLLPITAEIAVTRA